MDQDFIVHRDGSITVASSLESYKDAGDRLYLVQILWLARISADGTLVWDTLLDPEDGGVQLTPRLALDDDDHALLALHASELLTG